MSTPSIKPKQLIATVTLSFSYDADSQRFGGFYDAQKQADYLKEQLEGDELSDTLLDVLDDDLAVVNVEVNVTDPNVETETPDEV